MTATSTPPANIFPLLASQKGRLIVSSVLAVIATALMLVPFVIVYLVAIDLFNPPIDTEYIWQLVFISFLAIVGRFVLIGIAGVLSHIAAFNILYDIRIKLSEKLGKLPLGYFNYKTTGSLKKVMDEDVEYLEVFIAHGIPETTGIIATLILTVGYLFVVDWRMTLAACAGIVLALGSLSLMFKSGTSLMKSYYLAKDRMNATIIEYVQGMAAIKAFTQTTESFAKYGNSVRDYHEIEEEWSLQSVLPWTLFTLSITANIIFLLPAGILLLNNGTLSMPVFILFLLLGLGICAPLYKAMQSMNVLVQTQQATERIHSILNAPILAEPETPGLPADLTIEFKDVHFSYQEAEILQGISLVIPPKKITALVGPSGSGKTTIARLIARFWDVNSGEILLGGVNIKNLKTEDLMSKIAFVFQDVVLFNDTIAENIRMGNPAASQAAVIAAAKAAQCHDFIATLPEGYDTIIGERGKKLSGGQQQRISIARAILKDAPIVVLDEATAFIDSENEAQIQAAIAGLIQDKTLLVIAHRLSTITEADQIIAIDRGKFSGRGTHEELLKNNDLYRSMWEAHVSAQTWSF
jgi:ATP-binding cassette subfamily B protein